MQQRQRRSPSHAPGLSRKTLALVLFAALASAAGLALLRPDAAEAALSGQAGPTASAAVTTPDLLWMNGGHAGGSGKAALSPDGQLLATADYSEVFVWRYADGRLLRTFGAYWLGSMKCVRFTPDGQHVVGAGTWIPGQTVRDTVEVFTPGAATTPTPTPTPTQTPNPHSDTEPDADAYIDAEPDANAHTDTDADAGHHPAGGAAAGLRRGGHAAFGRGGGGALRRRQAHGRPVSTFGRGLRDRRRDGA
jgi:hypothetical protein